MNWYDSILYFKCSLRKIDIQTEFYMIRVPFAGFVNLAYQPPYNNIFLSEQINH
jgi:hypothetical protein